MVEIEIIVNLMSFVWFFSPLAFYYIWDPVVFSSEA